MDNLTNFEPKVLTHDPVSDYIGRGVDKLMHGFKSAALSGIAAGGVIAMAGIDMETTSVLLSQETQIASAVPETAEFLVKLGGTIVAGSVHLGLTCALGEAFIHIKKHIRGLPT